MAVIIDPDSLVAGTDVVFNTTTKTIRLVPGTNITDEGATGGVTGQALYSFCKDRWKADASLIKYPFPMEAITPEQFEFISGWTPYDDATRKLIRTAGWAEKTALGVTTRKYSGVVSLGTLGLTDQPYFQFGTGSATDFTYQGPVNEAVQIFGDASNGNFDYSGGTAFKLFCREQGKKYASSNNTAIGASTLTTITYRFPLSNETDLKISASDVTISGIAPWNQITVEYFGTDQLFDVDGDTITEPYRIIVTDASGVASTQQIYEKIQYQLRQNSDVDAGAGSVIGKTADALLAFVGDTLVGSNGVRIAGLNGNYLNSVEFYDKNGTKRLYPFVSAGTLTFNSNLQGDASAKYWMFFKTLPGATNDYGESGAVIVKDKDGVDITGLVSGLASKSFTFSYDSNIQGGRTPATDADVVVVAIGESTAQFVSTEVTLTRTKGIGISLASALERNYVV